MVPDVAPAPAGDNKAFDFSRELFTREEDKGNLGGYNFYDMAYVQPEKKVYCVFDYATAKKYHWDTPYPFALCFAGGPLVALRAPPGHPPLPAPPGLSKTRQQRPYMNHPDPRERGGQFLLRPKGAEPVTLDSTTCHTPHAMPPAKGFKDKSANIEYCYSCHHNYTFQKCSECHK